jgi:uncharacterized repeat protein (TIGR01451 family)
MKLKNQIFTGIARVFFISLVGMLLLSLGIVDPVQADGPPDFKIEITDSGNFAQGGTGAYTITVTNTSANLTDGTRFAVSVFNFPNEKLSNVSIADSGGWACSPVPTTISEGTPLECERYDILGAGAIPSIVISADVNVDAPPTLPSIEAEVRGGGDIPDELPDIDDTAALETSVIQKPDLTLTKVMTSTPVPANVSYNFVQGGVGTYTITVKNSATNGASTEDTDISVTYTLPAGLTLATVTGTNWDCASVALTCTRVAGQRVLAPGSSFEPITLNVNVAWNAAASVTNTVTVSGGGEVIASNSSNADPTAIEPKPDLYITSAAPYPAAPFDGQDFVLRVNGMNRGGVGSGSVVYAYAYIADPLAVSCELRDENPSDLQNDTPVDAGLPFLRSIPFLGGLDEGTYKVCVSLDAIDIVHESVESNNVFGPIAVNIGQAVVISGNVGGVAGVSMRYAIGGVAYTATSGTGGGYTISLPKNWTGTITPVKTGYVFSPLSKTYTSPVTTNQVQNFAIQQFAISGNAGAAGVSLRYVVGGVTKTATSNASGNYTLTVPSNWVGAVTPSKTGYSFLPASISYSTLAANQVNQNYVPVFISNAAQDGWVLESSEKSNRGGSINQSQAAFILGDNAVKKQFRSILSFDTSFLPDNASITSVVLKIRRNGVVGGGDPVITFGGFMVDVKKGSFGTLPLAASDFQAAANRTIGPFKPVLTGGWYNLSLNNAKAYVNKLGTTQIRLRFKLDDNNNAVSNYMSFSSGNAGTAVYRPMLVIKYTLP